MDWSRDVLLDVRTLLLDFGLTFLIIVRLLNGFATGYISTALNTLATIILPEDRRGEGISYFSLSLVLASSIGPFVSFTILKICHSIRCYHRSDNHGSRQQYHSFS